MPTCIIFIKSILKLGITCLWSQISKLSLIKISEKFKNFFLKKILWINNNNINEKNFFLRKFLENYQFFKYFFYLKFFFKSKKKFWVKNFFKKIKFLFPKKFLKLFFGKFYVPWSVVVAPGPKFVLLLFQMPQSVSMGEIFLVKFFL